MSGIFYVTQTIKWPSDLGRAWSAVSANSTAHTGHTRQQNGHLTLAECGKLSLQTKKDNKMAIWPWQSVVNCLSKLRKTTKWPSDHGRAWSAVSPNSTTQTGHRRQQNSPLTLAECGQLSLQTPQPIQGTQDNKMAIWPWQNVVSCLSKLHSTYRAHKTTKWPSDLGRVWSTVSPN